MMGSAGCLLGYSGSSIHCCLETSNTERTPGPGTAEAVTAFQECWTDTN